MALPEAPICRRYTHHLLSVLYCSILSLFVVAAALNYYYFRLGQFIDEAVFSVDAATPQAGKFVF